VSKVFKNLAVLVGVLVLSTAIYLLVSENRQLKQDVLERSLSLLGEQLLALIPQGQARETVAVKWQGLVEGVNKGEIAPEQVERVAVGILNASNLDKQISGEEAEIIINMAFVPSPMDGFEQMPPLPPPTIKISRHNPPPEVQHQKLAELGKKLETICAFNKKIKNSCAQDPAKQKVFVQNLRYELEDGIRLKADLQLKQSLDSENFKLWSQEMKRLEEEKLLDWRQNFALNLANEHQSIKVQIDSLRAVIEMQNAQKVEKQLTLVQVEVEKMKALQTLERLQHWQMVEPAALEKMVHEHLNETVKSR